MVIGKGMIAKAFSSYNENKGVIVFASGVSNSQEVLDKAFEKEALLLKEALDDCNNKTIVYFSTCSIYDLDLHKSAYVQHKLMMETLIQNSGVSYLIFRLPQVVGITKSPTLINFLHHCIQNNLSFKIWEYSKRNLIDVDDVFSVVNFILLKTSVQNKIINIASNQTLDIFTIVQKIEAILEKSAHYEMVKQGSYCDIDISEITPYLQRCNVHFDEEYIDKILLKYLKK